MKERLAVPATNGAGVGTKLHADLLPCIVVDVPILQNHALVGVRNRLNDLPYLFLKVW